MKAKKMYKAERMRDLRELITRADRLYGDNVFCKQIGPAKEIEEFTYHQLYSDMNGFGTKLLDMNLKDAHIALLGENSYEWVVSYLAVLNGVGVVVPLDKELTELNLANQINKSDCKAVLCTKTYAAAMARILPMCPQVEACVVINATEKHETFPTMQELIQEGNQLLESGEKAYLYQHIDIYKMAEILFTSGTTGANKGVMLSHNNLTAVVYSAMRLIRPGGTAFSVLPINHSYECSCHILPNMYLGTTICFNDSLKHVTQNMRLFQPSFAIMVPMFLEAMMRAIWVEAEKTNLTRHLKLGIFVSRIALKFGIDLRRKLFKPIHKNFGGNLTQIVCGGAPLRKELIDQFDNFGINVVNGYGITECAPLVSTNCTMWKNNATVGMVIPTCKVRVNEGGEIEVKGENVMLGYYNDPESTAVSFTPDGWFKTGDLGRLDKNGFLYITGREKNLIILPNGKNVSPEEIEELIAAKMPLVKEVVVFALVDGNQDDSRICAACYLDEEYISEHNIVNPEAMLRSEIRNVNKFLPKYKQVTDVRVMEVEFEKTTTKKIKRQTVQKELNHV